MQPTHLQIYQSILQRAADEWDVDYEDVERDIGQQYDPVVRFMAGAVASEMELVYQRLHDTETRIQERLAKTLLPEYYHLPTPAHALATATPSTESLPIDETAGFIRYLGEKEGDIAFSPVFPSRLIPGELKVMAIPGKILDAGQRAPLRMRAGSNVGERIGKVLLGIETKAEEINWKDFCLYFEIRGSSQNESEKARFYASLAKSRCLLNGEPIRVESGLPPSDFILEDYLNGNERLQNRVRLRYERHFLTIQDEKAPVGGMIQARDFLPKWLMAQDMSQEEADKQMTRLEKEVAKTPMIWLEVHFGYPVELVQFSSRLVVKLNVFPVVNRRLCGHTSGEHHYIANNAIKWIHLQPEEPFVSIRRVFEEKPPMYPIFTFKPFADFKEENKPSYTMRLGGVGRWDDFNAWKRMAYVVSILQENYGHEELVMKAAASLSLEDIHHLLGKKIKETSEEHKPISDIYVLLHTGATGSMRVRVEYWTSVGEAANGVAAKTSLKCTSKEASELEADTIEMVSISEGGGDPLEATEQLDAMKLALMTRGRIVTREDVKIFCKELLRDRLVEVMVRDGVGTDPRFDFGMTRRLEVWFTPSQESKEEDWEAICQQVQRLLEQKSSSNVPIHVQVSPNTKLQRP